MREATQAAIEKLRQNGYMITTADFQALMWYPEKQLFRKLGVAAGRGADNDYLDAAIMLAEKEGFTNDQINQALPHQTETEPSIVSQVPKDLQAEFLQGLVELAQSHKGQQPVERSTNKSRLVRADPPPAVLYRQQPK